VRSLTTYRWHTGKLSVPVRIAVISDLHGAEYNDIWPMLNGLDCLLIPGDIADRYRQNYDRGLCFIQEAAQRLPTFFAPGNHEVKLKKRNELFAALDQSEANILVNSFVHFGELWIGGWYRPRSLGMEDMLPEFETLEGCKVLLCHRPEDYMRHMRGKDLDLVLAGHAHGGQIRIGRQGLFSPGQGFFPKYTKGIVDERMIVNAGASNSIFLPRWGNPCEVVCLELD